MTVVKATSEEWQVWELDNSGLKLGRKPSKDKTSYEKCGCEDRLLGKVMGSRENIYTRKVQNPVSQKSAGAELARQGMHPELEHRPSTSASWLCEALPGTNSSL